MNKYTFLNKWREKINGKYIDLSFEELEKDFKDVLQDEFNKTPNEITISESWSDSQTHNFIME